MIRFFGTLLLVFCLSVPAVKASLIFSQSGDLCGTILSFTTEDEKKSCNAFRISDDLYVSNAHCVNGGSSVAEVCFNRDSSDVSNFEVENVFVNSEWDFKNPDNDIAVAKLKSNSLSKFVQKSGIGIPEKKCGYFMVSKVGDFEKLIPVCINDIGTEVLRMNVSNGYEVLREDCLGLSGSPIYQDDFDTLVGILSGVNDLNNCNENLLAVNLSNQLAFLNKAKDVLGDNNFSTCGEACAESSCAPGLFCNEGKCSHLADENVCESEDKLFCSAELDLGCLEGSMCLNDNCVNLYDKYIKDLEKDNRGVYLLVGMMTNKWTIALIGLSAIFFIMLILFVDEKSIRKI